MKSSILKIMQPYLNKKIILSVSGGIDSLVLFHILLKQNFDLVVVHFNHKKREVSKDEAFYLKELTKKENVPF